MRSQTHTLDLVATVHEDLRAAVYWRCERVNWGGCIGWMRNAITGRTLSLWSRAVSAGMSDLTSPPVRAIDYRAATGPRGRSTLIVIISYQIDR